MSMPADLLRRQRRLVTLRRAALIAQRRTERLGGRPALPDEPWPAGDAGSPEDGPRPAG